MERSHHVEAGSLEASLLQMINDHNHAAIELRERTEKAKKEAIRTAIRVSDLLVKAVNGGVQEIFMNEKRIEAEIRALTATIMRFSKQTDQWLTVSHSVNTAVKLSNQNLFLLLGITGNSSDLGIYAQEENGHARWLRGVRLQRFANSET